jgi:hypothetical protein
MTRRYQVIYTLAANITEIFIDKTFSKGNNINYSLLMSTKMAKHGKELSDDTIKAIIKLTESGHRAS